MSESPQARRPVATGDIPLCSLQELRERRCIGFDLENCPLFVVLLDSGEPRAYRNSCPHLDIELNWQPHGFLDYDQCFIQCKTHGALFRMDDGHCIVGPCNGQSLTPLALQERDGWLYLPDGNTGSV